MRAAVLLSAALAAASVSHAADGPIDTPRLLAYCEEAQKEAGANPFRAGYCYAFIEGTLRGWEAAAFVRDAPTNYCIAPGVTLGQIVGVVVKSLRDNPADMRGRAEVSVISAVQKAFPCNVPQKR